MSCPAGRKFCGCPELVEKLLSCLDINSIHSLCQALPSVVKVVRGNTFWNKLIRRTCITPVLTLTVPGWTRLSHLLGILKLMKDPGSPLLDLLDLICEKYPSLKTNGKNRRSDFVQVRCPRHGSHSVSPAGFLILEKVEAALESTEQSIKSFELRHLEEPTMSNLSSRISRQLAQDSTSPEEMNIEDIYCNSKASQQQGQRRGHLNSDDSYDSGQSSRLLLPVREGGWRHRRRGLGNTEGSALQASTGQDCVEEKSDVRR